MKNFTLNYLRSCCEDTLHELYPAGLPDEISRRYEHEIGYLTENPDLLDDFLLFKELSDAVKRTCGKLWLSGMVSNSILVYLLGDHELNPMPAHYYCPHCGYYHEQPETVVGLDLPEEKCPRCDTILRRDGFSLREEYVWKVSSGIDFEYVITSRLIPLARKVIDRHYAKQQRHTALISSRYCEENSRAFGIVVFPMGKCLADYNELIGITQDGEDCLRSDWGLLEQCDVKRIPLLSITWLDRLDELQWETGILNDNLTTVKSLSDVSYRDILNTSVLSQDEFDVFFKRKPETFREKTNLLVATRNSYSGPNRRFTDTSLDVFEKLADDPLFLSFPIHTRDDVFDILRSSYKDDDRAFLDAENMGKGEPFGAYCTFDPAVLAVMNLAQHIDYLHSRAYFQWRALQYTRLAKYLKLDRRTYCKVVFSHA